MVDGASFAGGLGVGLGVGFSESKVDMIDLNGCVDQVLKGIEIANECEGTLDVRLEPSGKEGKTGFIVDAKNVGDAFEFGSELGRRTSLLERGEPST